MYIYLFLIKVLKSQIQWSYFFSLILYEPQNTIYMLSNFLIMQFDHVCFRDELWQLRIMILSKCFLVNKLSRTKSLILAKPKMQQLSSYDVMYYSKAAMIIIFKVSKNHYQSCLLLLPHAWRMGMG